MLFFYEEVVDGNNSETFKPSQVGCNDRARKLRLTPFAIAYLAQRMLNCVDSGAIVIAKLKRADNAVSDLGVFGKSMFGSHLTTVAVSRTFHCPKHTND